MLDVFAQSDTACMRTHRYAELLRHQQDGQDLINSAQTATVDLAERNRPRLHQLLEQHTVLTVFPGCHPDGGDRSSDRRVAEDIVRARGLFDPPWVEARKPPHVVDGLAYVPALIRIHHE